MKNILVIISLFAFGLLSAQQETYEFNTVEDAINYAIENNNDLSKSRIDQEIILAQIAEVNQVPRLKSLSEIATSLPAG